MGRPVSLTSYPGVEGTDYSAKDGILFNNSRVRQLDVRDGTSNTLLIGERPPTFNYRFGWWYAGNGQNGTGSCDMVLGVRELAVSKYGCPPGPYHFAPTYIGAPCVQFFFWSLHDGGANFVFADGSVHFLTYQADSILPALATRAGGEIVSLLE
jgi:prepilin-type processing-associated H-X9-DG protein